MVCLSYLASGGFANARYLVRRLRRALPGVRILLGLWTHAPMEMDRDKVLKETEADSVAISLGQAVESVVAGIEQSAAGGEAMPPSPSVEASPAD